MISFTKIKWTLCALAFGVFFSCGSKVPEEPFPQDRNVGGLNIPDLRKGMTFPDTLSGWYLRWVPPLSTSGLTHYYVFEDTLDAAMVERLNNGTQGLDLTNFPPFHILPVSDVEKDTLWEIPPRSLGGKRLDEVSRTDRFRFTLWARYADGPIGQPVSYSFFLGDEMPPRIPTASEFQDSIGGQQITLRFPRPGDQTGRFDTLQRGPLRSIEFIMWPGRIQFDSAGKVVRWRIPAEDLANAAKDTLQIALTGLRFYTHYVVVMEAIDSMGNVARSPQMQYTTRDSLPPAEVQNLSSSVAGNLLVVTWTASTDTFGSDTSPLRASFPNRGIASYRMVLNGQVVDSVDLRGQSEAYTSPDPAMDTLETGRFRWKRPNWKWIWPNLRPGQPFVVEVQVQDLSGNDGIKASRDSGTSPAILDTTCPAGFVAVKGVGRLHDYCIEEHEHAAGDTAISRVTWSEAKAICERDGAAYGAQLCSEAQWVRACETSPSDSTKVYPYGAMEVGSGGDLDSLTWLQDACQLGTGDSTRARAVSNADPRCVSAWGVYDLPGRLGEWTLDVYTGVRDSSRLDSGNLAYQGSSDLKPGSDLGTLHGGSALVLQEIAQTLGSAKCRTRNYPASSEMDTLKTQGIIRRRPNPNGSSLGWGFRCCVTF
ncbi:MAG: SUMF1/EgtB/PvdO family nonheme iron enzyme [Fibrobacteres bacterium]|nr:SUMF1/EgtB/PvdO family nonheme iron enzyme [Fibrobacterota bacterium]